MTHKIADDRHVTTFDGEDHLVIVCECGVEFAGDRDGTRARHAGHQEIERLREQIKRTAE